MAGDRISPKAKAKTTAITAKVKSGKGTTRRKCHVCGQPKNIPKKSRYVYRDGTALCKECAGKGEGIEYSLPTQKLADYRYDT